MSPPVGWFTAGIAVSVPPHVPQLVLPPSFPYRRKFLVVRCLSYSTLVFDVFTSYEDRSGPLANVTINGVSVGTIPPHGWTQTGGELAPVTLQFGNGMINTLGPGGRTGWNDLEVVPGPNDWLVFGNWRIHYQQGPPP
jgi:hypothetical protein